MRSALRRVIPLTFLKHLSVVSTREALKRIMPLRTFRRAEAGCRDFREFVAICAQLMRVSEVGLTREIAGLAGYGFIERPMPIEPALITPELSLRVLRESGALIVSHAGHITGMACVEPERLKRVLCLPSSFKTYLATWPAISDALDQSEQRLIYLEQLRAREKREELCGKAKQVLELVIEEGRKKRACGVRFEFESYSTKYILQFAAGRSAAGTIDYRVSDSLQELLEDSEIIAASRVGPESFEIKLDTETSQEPAGEERPAPEFPRIFSTKPNLPELELYKGEILLIDDNQTFCRVLERYFLRDGLAVVSVHSCEEALERLSSRPDLPDLIICDVHLPGMSGIELLRKVKAEKRLRDIPFIMLSSDAEIETKLSVLRCGASLYVSKTDDPRLLHAYVRNLSARKEAA
ncbi:MAG: hypothetical protein DCC75_00065 [Proteobacteria bacterium]|nr:MAG: hypothetical protein DCC75_00065 [Pseudomonadota bacterium]